MTPYQRIIPLICFLTIWASSSAQANQLVSKVSNDEIPVHPNFQGQEISFFGAIVGDASSKNSYSSQEVVIAVRGPREDNLVQKKKQWAGIWLNDTSHEYINIPSYFLILSNRAANAFLNLEDQHAYQLSLNGLFLPNEHQQLEKNTYREALIRLKTNKGLYIEQTDAIEFLNENTFLSSFFLPPDLPIGSYMIDFYLFRDGIKVAKNTHTLNVYREGLSADIFTLSRAQPAIYGLATLLILMLTAYITHFLVRKD